MPSRADVGVTGVVARRRAPIALALGGGLLVVALLAVLVAAPAGRAPGRLATVVNWLPYLLTGFMYNVLISLFCMFLATVAGAFVGLGQVSLYAPVRRLSAFYTHFFRNSPWLVILYSMLYLLPFEVTSLLLLAAIVGAVVLAKRKLDS